MRDAVPSGTAYRVALRRAAHQVFDDPVVFRDPLALRILGLTPGSPEVGDMRAPRRPFSRSLRAFLVARSLFAEEVLAAAVARGVNQYVLLGAGLDTFAYRNPFPGLRVFEVDHPATQAGKLAMLRQNGIAIPPSCTHLPVDFERQKLRVRLEESMFRPAEPTVFALLGVVPYLTPEALGATLDALADLPAPGVLVMDYGLPPSALPLPERLAAESLAARVAAAGEPFRQFFFPEGIAQRLLGHGFAVAEDLDVQAINQRYFGERGDGLRVLGRAAHLLAAEG